MALLRRHNRPTSCLQLQFAIKMPAPGYTKSLLVQLLGAEYWCWVVVLRLTWFLVYPVFMLISYFCDASISLPIQWRSEGVRGEQVALAQGRHFRVYKIQKEKFVSILRHIDLRFLLSKAVGHTDRMDCMGSRTRTVLTNWKACEEKEKNAGRGSKWCWPYLKQEINRERKQILDRWRISTELRQVKGMNTKFGFLTQHKWNIL